MQRDRTVTTPDASAKVTPPTEKFTPAGLNLYVPIKTPSRCDSKRTLLRCLRLMEPGPGHEGSVSPCWMEEQCCAGLEDGQHCTPDGDDTSNPINQELWTGCEKFIFIFGADNDKNRPALKISDCNTS